jgi:uncharacterized Zn finger protein (UPF0148 family)
MTAYKCPSCGYVHYGTLSERCRTCPGCESAEMVVSESADTRIRATRLIEITQPKRIEP